MSAALPSTGNFSLFIAAALLIAVTPGPGVLYVAARTLAGGRAAGMASTLGAGVGGLVHVVAGAVGVSALVVASAEAFTLLKIAGAVYLVWLGAKTIRAARVEFPIDASSVNAKSALRQGVLVEALNPKTAAFFLAFIPQFIDLAQAVATQFVMLGLVSVALNTAVDIVVVYAAARARSGFASRPAVIQRIREGSGVLMCGLGVSLFFARRTS